jgi:hypothetical protein
VLHQLPPNDKEKELGIGYSYESKPYFFDPRLGERDERNY